MEFLSYPCLFSHIIMASSYWKGQSCLSFSHIFFPPWILTVYHYAKDFTFNRQTISPEIEFVSLLIILIIRDITWLTYLNEQIDEHNYNFNWVSVINYNDLFFSLVHERFLRVYWDSSLLPVASFICPMISLIFQAWILARAYKRCSEFKSSFFFPIVLRPWTNHFTFFDLSSLIYERTELS